MNSLLNDFLSLSLPHLVEPHEGFLEITGQQYKEVINSRVYAYFLDSNKNREVAELFRDALLAVYADKQNHDEFNFDLQEFRPRLEVTTANNNRIDILLDDEMNRRAVIVENKIFHTPVNPFGDYWNHVKYKEEDKLGVLLTLAPEIPPKEHHENWVNILHIEWVRKISQMGLPVGLPLKTYHYLNDFFDTIESITMQNEMDESLEYYYKHRHKINEAEKLVSHARSWVLKNVKALVPDDWKSYGQNDRWLQMWPENTTVDAYFTITFDTMIQTDDGEPPHFYIIIQIEKSAIEHSKAMSRKLGEPGKARGIAFHGTSKNGWEHWAIKKYEPTLEQMQDLSGTIWKSLQDDFWSLWLEVEKYLSANHVT